MENKITWNLNAGIHGMEILGFSWVKVSSRPWSSQGSDTVHGTFSGNYIIFQSSYSILCLWMIYKLLIRVVSSFPVTISHNYFSNFTASPGRYNCTRFTHFLCFSPVRRSSVEVHCIILIPSKEILWQSGEIQLGKGMDLYTEQLGAWKISPSFTTGLWLWTKYIGIAKLKNWRKPVSTITQELMKFENTLVFKNGLFLATLFWMILSYLESEIFPYAQVAVCNFTFLICVKTISLTTT